MSGTRGVVICTYSSGQQYGGIILTIEDFKKNVAWANKVAQGSSSAAVRETPELTIGNARDGFLAGIDAEAKGLRNATTQYRKTDASLGESGTTLSGNFGDHFKSEVYWIRGEIGFTLEAGHSAPRLLRVSTSPDIELRLRRSCFRRPSGES